MESGRSQFFVASLPNLALFVLMSAPAILLLDQAVFQRNSDQNTEYAT